MDDDALLARQDGLQREARAFLDGIELRETLAKAGRVVPLGSLVTGLMVWRDVDFVVSAPEIEPRRVWETMAPLLARCSTLRYVDERDDELHYFVMRIDGWKVDVSLWRTEIPPIVEEFQAELLRALADDDALRLAVLRLKEAWHPLPAYPETVSAWQIYDAALHHGVRDLDALDAYLRARGLPPRS